jgi:hypothetical protein
VVFQPRSGEGGAPVIVVGGQSREGWRRRWQPSAPSCKGGQRREDGTRRLGQRPRRGMHGGGTLPGSWQWRSWVGGRMSHPKILNFGM